MDDAELKEITATYEREIRKLKREITHMKHAISQEKTAYTTVLNQQKASTFIMRERERYLMLLLANSPSIILFLSQTERVEFVTDYFVAKAGFKSAGDISGRTLSEVLSPFLDPEAHDKLLEQSRSVMQTNVPISFEISFSFNRKDSVEDFDGMLVPMNDEQDKSKGIMLLLHDVSDLKRSREEAMSANVAKSAFLSSMSHEIRTPMNAIIGMTSIGKREEDPEKMINAFNKIEIASTHLLGIINDILDISKIEAGKMELSCIDFSFAQMIDRVSSVISIKMHDKQLSFVIEIDPQIPDKLFGDDQRLAQVITNLLSNSTKFTPEGGSITLGAELKSLYDGGCVLQIFVRDSGIGMSKEDQSKLFVAFQQTEAGTARKYGGTGLGLAISKSIVDMMDGKFWVESEPGKGSCFFFTVSLAISSESASSMGGESLESYEDAVLSADFTGKTALIVDDLEINLEILVELLIPTNITMDTALNGRRAAEMYSANPTRYDIILMDMQMPEVDGLQATRMIRALGTREAETVPIIAMTANVFREDIERCLDAGMNNHLGKPIEIDVVIKMLQKYLH